MQRQFEGIIRSATEAIITIDESQKILIFNPMAETLFACTAEDAIGTSLDRFIPVRYRSAHARQVQEFGVTGTSERQMGKRLPLFGLRADGVEFPIEASISQFVEQAGNPRWEEEANAGADDARVGSGSDGIDAVGGDVGCVPAGRRLYTVLLRDITARLKAEAEIQASRNELRQLSASIQAAREHEQLRIARELHDDLGQRLTALKVDVSLLEAELDEQTCTPGDASERWRGRTRAMQRLIDDTVQAVRRIAADLRPVMLDDLGLVAAIDWLASEWRGRHGIVVTVRSGASGEKGRNASANVPVRASAEASDDTASRTEAISDADTWPITDDAATAIFRIVQEALTNIARHANATRAIVTLEQTVTSLLPGTPRQPCYRIWIADNGVGLTATDDAPPKAFSDHPAEARRSFGLIGMRERATLMGGVLQYGSPDDVVRALPAAEHDGTSEDGATSISRAGRAAMFDAGCVICVTVPCAAVAQGAAR
jgi:PAS domain S-box-containing protein